MSLSELWQIVVLLWQIVVNYPINWVMVFQVIGVGVLIILVIALVSLVCMVLEWGLDELAIRYGRNRLDDPTPTVVQRWQSRVNHWFRPP